jgi:hypothetical protein
VLVGERLRRRGGASAVRQLPWQRGTVRGGRRGGRRAGPDVPIGWPNRFLVVTYVAWLAVAAWTLLQR